jgi:hypothetical protein
VLDSLEMVVSFWQPMPSNYVLSTKKKVKFKSDTFSVNIFTQLNATMVPYAFVPNLSNECKETNRKLNDR